MKEDNIILKNKKINFLYETKKIYKVGLNLSGLQVKNIKNKKIDITNSFAKLYKDEIFWTNFIFHNNNLNKDIRLLLNKREIIQIKRNLVSSFSLVPKNLFYYNSLIKMELHLVKGKKKYNYNDSKFKTKKVRKAFLGDE